MAIEIEVVKAQIARFLSTDTPEVLAIKGAWGIGKTYSWKKFLNEAKGGDGISLKRYSYVSLFGVDSLQSFKQAIFENSIPKESIGVSASIETLKGNLVGNAEVFSRKYFGLIRDNSFVKAFASPGIVDSLAFLSLNNTLICIDDLERRGKNLPVRDVLGLVSLLKEEKMCKIIMLLNEDEDGLEEYEKYREKVVDIEIVFSPSAKECAAIAYDRNGCVYDALKRASEKLDIRNIRVLKKIERLVDMTFPVIRKYEQELREQVIHSLVLFSWCYYRSDNDAPTLDFVSSITLASFLGLSKKTDESEQHKKWKIILDSYGYRNTDELDVVISEIVRTGYVVEERLIAAAEKRNLQIISEKSSASFSRACDVFHYGFNKTQEEVVDVIYKSIKDNAKYISPGNLNGVVRLFRELGEAQKASEIIDFYISERGDDKKLFDLANIRMFGEICDEEIAKKFEPIYLQDVFVGENIKQVLERIATVNGWSPSDEVILANAAVDEYYDLFTSDGGEFIHACISKCLDFGRFSNPTDRYKTIHSKARDALLKMANESKINFLRLKKYNIFEEANNEG